MQLRPTTNVKEPKTFQRIVNKYVLSSRKVLDVGCGRGQYLKYLGKGSVGITSAFEEVVYGEKHGLDIRLGNAETIDEIDLGCFDVIWANNLFEHLLSPHSFLMKLKAHADQETLLILGVPVVPKIISLLRLRKFRGALATNHINFFTANTLKLTVERAGWNIIAVRPFVLKSMVLDRLCSFAAPHLYVIAKNDSKFVYPAKKLNEWKDLSHYDWLLRITKQKD